MHRMKNLRERVAHVAPRIEAHFATMQAYGTAEDGLAFMLLSVAWPALRAAAAEYHDRTTKLLDGVYILAEDEPCLETRDADGSRNVIRGQTQIAAELERMHVSETAKGIDAILTRWERETEGDAYLDNIKSETKALLEVRAVLHQVHAAKEPEVNPAMGPSNSPPLGERSLSAAC